MSADDKDERMIPIPAGSFLTVTTGEYSEYEVSGVFRVLKDIDADALREQWLSDHPDQRKNHHFNDPEFLAWVAREGYIEPIDSYEWHLSDYSSCDEMNITAP